MSLIQIVLTSLQSLVLLLSRPYHDEFWFGSSGLGAVQWECWFLISVSSCTEVSPPWLWPHIPLSPVISSLHFSFYRASTCDSPHKDICMCVSLRVFTRAAIKIIRRSCSGTLIPCVFVCVCIKIKHFRMLCETAPQGIPLSFNSVVFQFDLAHLSC